MKLIIQRSNVNREVITSEIKNIRELLSQLENELQEEFEEQEEEMDSNEVSEPQEIIETGKFVVSESDDEILIEMTAPDFQKEDFFIEVGEDGILSVTASNEIGGSIRSINKSKFYHSFQLPEDADMNDIEATYRNNMLTISIGKITTEIFDEESVN